MLTLKSSNQRQVLDKGYVRIVDHMGSDLSVVNAARVSFEKESEEFSDKDQKLLNYLIRKNEFSPFRHATMTFEVYAPLMVARQWWKYVVGSDHRDPITAWNESSRRYVTEEPSYYTPRWRGTPENKKQGSTDFIEADEFTHRLAHLQDLTIEAYEEAIEHGIAPEQARVFLLGYGMYVRWRWTASLEGVMHFLNQRVEESAQYEIQQYAHAVYYLAEELYPISISACPRPTSYEENSQ